jgi:hypothetical protein
MFKEKSVTNHTDSRNADLGKKIEYSILEHSMLENYSKIECSNICQTFEINRIRFDFSLFTGNCAIFHHFRIKPQFPKAFLQIYYKFSENFCLKLKNIGKN